MNKIIEESFKLKEENLSPYATLSSDGIRLKDEDNDFRTSFFRDIDRIINYSSYTRYINKTQVFSFLNNDNVQTRIVHVSLVSKISRTIGRALRLNEDLIEAIALGHDIGHPPMGHVGEKILNEISIRELNEVFMHNLESVRNYMFLENDGVGSNLTVQVLDGILCHNGEVLHNIYKPKVKNKDDFLKEYYASYQNHLNKVDLIPMTLEGCVVRISDIISYVGRDIEDAIRLNFIQREDIPKRIVNVLGDNNRDIVNTLVNDIISNSYGKNYLMFSDDVYKALQDLIDFNYQNIYLKANSEEQLDYYKKVFNTLFDVYYHDLLNNNQNSSIYLHFLHKMSSDYNENTLDKRKVIDYLSLMTDEFLIKEYEKVLVNQE